jgi:hypothetical protein
MYTIVNKIAVKKEREIRNREKEIQTKRNGGSAEESQPSQ